MNDRARQSGTGSSTNQSSPPTANPSQAAIGDRGIAAIATSLTFARENSDGLLWVELRPSTIGQLAVRLDGR
jgi:hypothetical protein